MTNVQDPGALSTSGDHEPLVYLADGNLLTLQDNVDLLRTSFERQGDDLVLGNADRPALVILDYFTPGNASDLATDGGAVLPARVVAKLAGPDPAQDAPSSNQTVIGHVETVSGEVIITRADGSQVVATVGTPVFEDDVVVTADGGAIGLRFIDGMTLSLGSDARMVLDEFAYNPEANEGGGIIEIIQGAFSFVSGAAARMGLDSLVIDTPTMTIGIRGTKVVANASAEGETTDVVLLPEDDGTIGKIMIKTDAGEELLETAFSATSVTSRLLPPAPQTEVTPDWVYAYFSDPIAALPTPTIDDDGPTINRPDIGLGPQIDTTINARPRGTIERIEDQPSNQRLADNERDGLPVEPSPSPTTSASDETRNDPTPVTVQEEPTSDEADLTDEPEFGGFDADKLLVEDATPENSSPTIVSPINNTGTDEDAVFSYNIAGSFTDDDLARGDSLTFNAAQSDGTALPAWLAIDPTAGVLSGTPTNDDVGTLSLIVTATDEAGASVSTTFQLTVDNINDQPVVSTAIADATPTEDLLFTYDVSGNFTDEDTLHGDSLTFGATLSDGTVLPAWLSIDATTGILSGTPDTTDVGVAYTIAVTATDASGSHVTSTFQVTVSNTNDAPTVSTPINDTNAAEDAAFSYDISGNFADDDLAHGDSLTFSAEQNGGAPLPAWLAIDPSTGVLSGTPDNDDVGTITVAVTATDDAGAAVTDNFQLTVDNTNDTPVVVTTISDTSTAEDAAFSYDVSGNFTDDDLTHGDSLTFSAEQNGGAPLP
ncbi:MAG: putative Ig domain-containing protein, partial [Pseudomonadota bacterium]